MSTEWCAACHTPALLSDLLLVTRLADGATRHVHRPGVAVALCFLVVGPASVERIEPADREQWDRAVAEKAWRLDG